MNCGKIFEHLNTQLARVEVTWKYWRVFPSALSTLLHTLSPLQRSPTSIWTTWPRKTIDRKHFNIPLITGCFCTSDCLRREAKSLPLHLSTSWGISHTERRRCCLSWLDAPLAAASYARGGWTQRRGERPRIKTVAAPLLQYLVFPPHLCVRPSNLHLPEKSSTSLEIGEQQLWRIAPSETTLGSHTVPAARNQWPIGTNQ